MELLFPETFFRYIFVSCLEQIKQPNKYNDIFCFALSCWDLYDQKIANKTIQMAITGVGEGKVSGGSAG